MFTVGSVSVDFQPPYVYTMYKQGGAPHADKSTEMG